MAYDPHTLGALWIQRTGLLEKRSHIHQKNSDATKCLARELLAVFRNCMKGNTTRTSTTTILVVKTHNVQQFVSQTNIQNPFFFTVFHPKIMVLSLFLKLTFFFTQETHCHRAPAWFFRRWCCMATERSTSLCAWRPTKEPSSWLAFDAWCLGANTQQVGWTSMKHWLVVWNMTFIFP